MSSSTYHFRRARERKELLLAWRGNFVEPCSSHSLHCATLRWCFSTRKTPRVIHSQHLHFRASVVAEHSEHIVMYCKLNTENPSLLYQLPIQPLINQLSQRNFRSTIQCSSQSHPLQLEVQDLRSPDRYKPYLLHHSQFSSVWCSFRQYVVWDALREAQNQLALA